MAKNKSTTRHPVIDEDRRRLALEASWELENLLLKMIELSQDFEDIFMRGVLIRAKDLACIVMSAVDDDLDTIDNMRERLTGLSQRALAEAAHG